MSGVHFDAPVDDFRVVYRQETFDDLAVRELAKCKAACICRIQYGRCSRRECKHCAQEQRYRNCYNQMDDFNKERLGNYVGQYYSLYSSNPTGWKSFRYLVSESFMFLLLILLCCIVPVLIWICSEPQASPSGGIPKDLDQKIVYCMKYAQQRVYDRNLDQKVNCIDYTITFKEQWDAMYPKQKSICFIIRNKSSHYKKFHHLFIGIYYMGGYIFVEPWAADPERYLMIENWDRRYDPKYNIYGETEKWMKEKIW